MTVHREFQSTKGRWLIQEENEIRKGKKAAPIIGKRKKSSWEKRREDFAMTLSKGLVTGPGKDQDMKKLILNYWGKRWGERLIKKQKTG